MNVRTEHLVAELINRLGSAPMPTDVVTLLTVLQQWLKHRLRAWSAPVRVRWGLDHLAELELAHYPLDDATIDAAEEIRQLDAVRPATRDTLAMRVRGLFWQGITVESPVLCPGCEATQLLILEEPTTAGIILCCNACGWSQTPEGGTWTGPGPLTPPSKARIHAWRRSVGDRPRLSSACRDGFRTK